MYRRKLLVMHTRLKKHSENENLNNLSVSELRNDLRKVLILTGLCGLLSYITFQTGECFRESLMCTFLGVIASSVIGSFYFKARRK